MQDADLYFTHTIVGAPMTVVLGRPQRTPAHHAGAMVLDAGTGRAQLTPSWGEWLAARTAMLAPIGTPWRRPGKVRRFVARHALLLACSGWLVALGLAVAIAIAIASGWTAFAVPQWPQWLQLLQRA